MYSKQIFFCNSVLKCILGLTFFSLYNKNSSSNYDDNESYGGDSHRDSNVVDLFICSCKEKQEIKKIVSGLSQSCKQHY